MNGTNYLINKQIGSTREFCKSLLLTRYKGAHFLSEDRSFAHWQLRKQAVERQTRASTSPKMNASLALAQRQSFNPWTVPDDFTVFSFAPDYVQPLLHPHWQTQKAVHPIWAYFFGLYYLILGNVGVFLHFLVC